jgi:hypothetical protein
MSEGTVNGGRTNGSGFPVTTARAWLPERNRPLMPVPPTAAWCRRTFLKHDADQTSKEIFERHHGKGEREHGQECGCSDQ